MMFHKWQLILAIPLALSFSAEASRSILNPMAPRVIHQQAYEQDYSYGYSILQGNAIDSLETPNRVVGWTLNYEIFDRYFLRHVARGYSQLPSGVQNSVGNFLFNLTELNNIVNNALLADAQASAISLGRFGINSTLGILGLFDVASELGLERQPMAMETVLGRAGTEQGPYLMVPLYGPATARDVHGDMADSWPYMFVPFYVKLAQWCLSGVHTRAMLLDQEGVVDKAIDPYAATRDIYLSYNEGLVDPDAAMRADEEPAFDESYLDEIDAL